MRWCVSWGEDVSIVVHARCCTSRACETTGVTKRERKDRRLRRRETHFPSEAIALPFEGRRVALLQCRRVARLAAARSSFRVKWASPVCTLDAPSPPPRPSHLPATIPTFLFSSPPFPIG